MSTQREQIVVSVGGSLIVPNHIDTDFLSRLKSLVLEQVERGFSFTIIAGGGKTARRYQDAANAVTPLSPVDTDWIGIHATRLNAQLLRNIFVGHARPQIIKDPNAALVTDDTISIAAGWKPGNSTDYVAVEIAKQQGARRLVNLSNIDYVYTVDPREDPNAEKIEKTSWATFRSIIPSEWDPGLSTPFDPVAAREAEALGLEVAIINGARLDSFENYLYNEPFAGTIIS